MTDAASPAAHAEEYTTPWGVKVRGERWGAGPDRVLLLHEPGADIDAWLGLPRAIARALPVGAVAYDLPGHGLSDDPWEPGRLPDLLRASIANRDEDGRTILIAAGDTAGAALSLAAGLPLAGLVCLSPGGVSMPVERSPRVPKLLLAGAPVEDDVDRARALAGQAGGWAMVTSVPVNARGAGLLDSGWQARITEEIIGFLRDCLYARRTHPAGMVPRPTRPE